MKYKLNSETCVNSQWPAEWLRPDYEDCCQCPVECKVVLIDERNNRCIVNEREYKKLLNEGNIIGT